MDAKGKGLFIALTAYKRPVLLESLLHSLKCAEGIARWQVCIGIDFSDELQNNLAVIERYRHDINIEFWVNQQTKGIRQNPFDTICHAFNVGAKHVLLLEDDLTVAVDALDLCEQLALAQLDESTVMCANLLLNTCCSESIFDPVDQQERQRLANVFIKTRFFSSYGLFFSAQQWHTHFLPNWFSDQPRMENWSGGVAIGWDVAMNRSLLTRPYLKVLQCLVPRVNHHGAAGTHVTQSVQQRGFDNLILDKTRRIPAEIVVLDPIEDLERVESAQARLYLNLCRHLWTLQESSLLFKHAVLDFTGKKIKRIRFFSREYLIMKRRLPKHQA